MRPLKLISLISLCIFAAALGACDDIASDDRYKELGKIDPKRTVLLEEYTGQLCVNCPTAHEVISQLEEQYGDRFIAVSFHCGGEAFSIQQNDPAWQGIVGLATPVSENYGKAAGVSALPKGRVDRVGDLTNPSAWPDAVRRQIAIDSNVELSLSGGLNPEKTSIKVDARIISPSDIKGAKLQLWVIESGIKALQLMPDGNLNMDYIHNNVFRADVNGFGGESVSIQSGVYTDKSFEISVEKDWVADNLSVVALVYTDSEVVQAAKLKMKNN